MNTNLTGNSKYTEDMLRDKKLPYDFLVKFIAAKLMIKEYLMYKILIIEDDMTISKMIKEHLCKWDYNTDYVTDFKNIIEHIVQFEPHLVLMDIGLPFYNGFHWCNEIRKFSKVPVIFISSAGDNMNIVMAMNMGADDFIAKPFDLNVLTAKIGAMIRRAYSFKGNMNIIEHNGLILNIADASLSFNDNKIELTKNDLKILQLLMDNAGKIVSREEIMQLLWSSDSFIDDNTLTVNVTRLRKKLDDIGARDVITTKKGIGYMVK